MLVDISYSGVCHSDVHQSRGEWGDQFATNYPCLPGHEIVGRVRAVGTKHAVGDLVGVVVIVDSCQRCEACQQNLEQYCLNGATATYNSKDETTGEVTFGGYSDSIVVTESFVLEIPEVLDAPAAAPLLCAGITTWSPLRHFDVGAAHKPGVLGLGGLGHLAVKLANGLVEARRLALSGWPLRAWISVSMMRGRTALTRMPSLPTSLTSPIVIVSTAALDAA